MSTDEHMREWVEGVEYAAHRWEVPPAATPSAAFAAGRAAYLAAERAERERSEQEQRRP